MVMSMYKNSIPIGYELFSGNMLDTQTLKPVMRKFIDKHNLENILIVADRGMMSGSNEIHILQNGNDYLFAKSVKKAKKEIKEWILVKENYIENKNKRFRYKSKIIETRIRDENVSCHIIKEINYDLSSPFLILPIIIVSLILLFNFKKKFILKEIKKLKINDEINIQSKNKYSYEKIRNQNILEIAKIISINDKIILENMQKCLSDPKKYLAENRKDFEEIYPVLPEDSDTITWRLGLVAFLENLYVCELDYKEEKDEFLYWIRELINTEIYNLSIENNWLDENENISQWCKAIDEKWRNSGFCLGCIDIDSDSYVLFPCKIENLEKLDILASQIGHKITYARNS